MINSFTFKSDNAFSLNLPPLITGTDNDITGSINWGDGSTSEYTSNVLSHSYSDGGTYTVVYTTDGSSIGNGFCANNDYLISVKLDENLKVISAGTFYYTSNLTEISIPSNCIVENSSFTGSAIKFVTFGRFKKPFKVELSQCGVKAFQNCISLEKMMFYTEDKEKQGTSEDYFILDDTNYITIKYLKCYEYAKPTIEPLQTNYINIYDMKETNFNHNGLRILSPNSCSIKEDLNGDYSITLEHIIDDDGAWKTLKEFNIIKVRGQLFRIKTKDTQLKEDGTAIRTIYAKHITYDLADKLIISCDVSGMSGQQALDTIYNSIFDDDIDGAYQEFYFQHYSDIQTVYINNNSDNPTFELTSPIACIIGEDNSIINQLGGELYRDNFYFSICNRMENSRDNCFQLIHGLNMVAVKENIDITDFCSYLYTKDNYGNTYAVAYTPSLNYPHNISKGKLFNYNQSNIEALGLDMQSHFKTINEPKVTYTINYKDLSNIDLYKNFMDIANLNIGDTGTIYSEDLGISTTQKIISKTIDGITGETISLTLSNQDNSFSRNRYENTISKADNIMSRIASPYRIRQVESEEVLKNMATQGKLEKGVTYAVMKEDDT
ncbi:MAG: phage tail protein [Oscillospiraceae bacterium]